MGKRGAVSQAAAVKATKKTKTDPAISAIADSISQVADLPEKCRDMLIDSLPSSLTIPKEKRHPVHAAIVDMVQETLETKQSAMQAAVAGEAAKIEELEASRVDRSKGVEKAEAELATQHEAVQAVKESLAETTTAVKASLKSLDELRATHKATSDKLVSTQSDQAALEKAFSEHFKPLLEGAGGEHLKELQPFLQNLDIEASLLIAVPSSCAKPKAERGSFDTVVLQELEKALASKITSFGESIARDTPVCTEQEASMLAAKEEYDAKADTQKRTVAEFEAAQQEEAARKATLDAAKQFVNELQPAIDAANKLLDEAKFALEAFNTGPMAQFASFSTLTSAAVEAAATEAVAPLGA